MFDVRPPDVLLLPRRPVEDDDLADYRGSLGTPLAFEGMFVLLRFGDARVWVARRDTILLCRAPSRALDHLKAKPMTAMVPC